MAAQELIEYRRQGKRLCVFFIHGFCGQAAATWGDFGPLLTADSRLANWDVMSFGYDSNLRPDAAGIWKGAPDIPTVADQLRSFLAHNLKDYEGFDLIAHSMGGLVAQRALVDDEALRRRTRSLLCFGTPSAGLVKARTSIFFLSRLWKRQLADMAAGSDFIMDLRHRWRLAFADRPPFRFVAAAGASDEFVPRSSSHSPFSKEHQAVVRGDHLSIVKPVGEDDPSVQLALSHLTETRYATHVAADRAAQEELEFRRVVATRGPRAEELDPAALVELVLAHDGLGESDQAISILDRVGDRGTDAMGVLAGRLKRRWQVDRVEQDGRKALSLYRNAFEQSGDDRRQRYYHAINVAFMTLALDGAETEARRWAECALDETEQSLLTSPHRDRIWRSATRGEALLHLMDVDGAIAAYRDAMNESPAPTPRQVDSMYKQAIDVAELLADENAAHRLVGLFGGKR